MLLKKKQAVYWDVDDIMLNSLETSVKIINFEYNALHNLPPKSASDVRDWNMKSIYRDITPEQIEEIFESEEFWKNVEFRAELNSLLTGKILKKYKHTFVTKGTQKNLEYKREFLSINLDCFDEFNFIGIESHISKGQIDMSGGIFIDDNIENLLESNADIKILLTNNHETRYNNAFGEFNDKLPDNLYMANNLSQVVAILEFNLIYKLN